MKWHYDPDDDFHNDKQFAFVVDEDLDVVARVEGVDHKEHAALIAAAPDLLAACQAARAFGSQGDTHEGLSVSEMLRAAILKATP